MGTVIVLGADDASASPDVGVPARDGAVSTTTTGSILLASCGPTDGPAIELISVPGVVCGTPPPAPPNQLVVMINLYPIPTGPGTIALTPKNSSASICRNSVCTPATGTLTFTTFSPNGQIANGSYAIKTAQGMDASSTFTATLCHNAATCG